MRWFRLLAVALLAIIATTSALALTMGVVSPISTHGASMGPRVSEGDLVVVRDSATYEVGDSAAYWSEELDTVVLHRIVAIGEGRYTFRGDNNSWLDPERPTKDKLIGKELIHIPQGGVWLDRLTSPTALGLLTFGLLATGGKAAHSRHSRRRRNVSQHAARPHQPRRPMAGLPQWATTVAAAAGIAGVLGVGLGALAWTTPTSTASGAAVVDTDSGQAMTFSYTADVPESPAYDDTTVTAPQPIFRKLTDDVEVEYTYRGEPGTIAVAAELSTASGWQSTVPLAPPMEITDDSYTGTVSLDLAALDRRAQAAAEAIGIPVSQVDIALVPTVKTGDGKPFAPELKLTLTPLQLSLAGDPSGLAVGGSADAEPAAAAGPETATLSLAGRELPVPTARMLSLILAAGALLAAALLAIFARLSAPATEGEAIHRRYGQMLVRVEPMPNPAGRPVIDVVDFPTLAKLAERYELLILHWSRSDVETFVVQDQGTTYRYRAGVGVVPQPGARTPAVV